MSGSPAFAADDKKAPKVSKDLAKTLKEAGIAAKAYPAEGKNHGTINAELGVPDDKPTKALYDFLDGVLTK